MDEQNVLDSLKDLVMSIEDNINAFISDAKKTVAPKAAWQRARKNSILLQKQFKSFRNLSVAAAKILKENK
jgi:hypothetical protein